MGLDDDLLPPVDFDFGAARTLITEIDSTKRLLSQQRQDRMTRGADIRTSWKGPYAVQHDVDRVSSDGRAQTLLAELDALRSRVQTAIDDAQRDQNRIDQHNRDARPHPNPQPGPSPVPPSGGGSW